MYVCCVKWTDCSCYQIMTDNRKHVPCCLKVLLNSLCDPRIFRKYPDSKKDNHFFLFHPTLARFLSTLQHSTLGHQNIIFIYLTLKRLFIPQQLLCHSSAAAVRRVQWSRQSRELDE